MCHFDSLLLSFSVFSSYCLVTIGITIIINNLQQPRLNNIVKEGFCRCEQAGERSVTLKIRQLKLSSLRSLVSIVSKHFAIYLFLPFYIVIATDYNLYIVCPSLQI